MVHRADGTLLGDWKYSRHTIGAGGFVTSGGVSNDGTWVIYMDTGPAMIRRVGDKDWTRLLRMEDNYNGEADDIGEIALACTIAQTDSNVICWEQNGALFYTTDGAATVNRLSMTANTSPFAQGTHLRIDPVDPSICFWFRQDGLTIFTNYWQSHTTISTGTLPAPTHNVAAIAFDPTSVSGGKCQRVYFNIPGRGKYMTADAGATFSNIDGTSKIPPVAGPLTVSPDTGTLHFVARSGYDRTNYMNGSWTQSHITTEWYYDTDIAPWSEPDYLVTPNNGGGELTWLKGSAGALNAGEFAYADNDGIGGKRIYIRMTPLAQQGGSNDPNNAAYVDYFFRWMYDTHYWRRPVGGTWTRTVNTATTPASMSGARVVADPHHPGRLIMPSEGSNYRTSTDDGLNWTGGDGQLDQIMFRKARDIIWHEWTNEYYLSHGDMWFDPTTADHLFLAEGIGCWDAPNAPNILSPSTPVTWWEMSVGIENMTMNNIRITEDGDMLATFWDRTGLAMPKSVIGRSFAPTLAPTSIDEVAVNSIGGQGMDYAPEDHDFLVCTAREYGSPHPEGWEIGGYSTNRGRTWQRFEGLISSFVPGSLGGGNIACFSKTVYVQLQIQNSGLVYTLDGGKTWANMVPLFPANFHQGYSYPSAGVKRKVLLRDRFHPNTVYFYTPGYDGTGGTIDAATRGCWKIVYNGDGTFTITRRRNTTIESFGVDAWNGHLVQYGDGWWLWTGSEGANYVWESKDDMATWSPVGGYDDLNVGSSFIFPYSVQVGGPALPGEPNTVLVYGHRPVVRALPTTRDYLGVWLCRNFTAADADRHWVRISKYVDQNVAGFGGLIPDGAGDPTEFGKFYFSAWGVQMLSFEDRRALTAPTVSGNTVHGTLSLGRLTVSANMALSSSAPASVSANISLGALTTISPVAAEIWAGIGDSTWMGQWGPNDKGDPAVDNSFPNVFMINAAGNIVPAALPLDSYFGSNDPLQLSPQLYFGKRRAEITGKPVFLINCAVGGAHLGSDSWGVGGSLQNIAVTRINAGIRTILAAVPGAKFMGFTEELGSNDGAGTPNGSGGVVLDGNTEPYYTNGLAMNLDLQNRITMNGQPGGTPVAGNCLYYLVAQSLDGHLMGFAGYLAVDWARRDIAAQVPGGRYFFPGIPFLGKGDLHWFSQGCRDLGVAVANWVSDTTPSDFVFVDYRIRANAPYIQELETADDSMHFAIDDASKAYFEIFRDYYSTSFGSDNNAGRARYFIRWKNNVPQPAGSWTITVTGTSGNGVATVKTKTVTVGAAPYTTPDQMLGNGLTLMGYFEASDLADGSVGTWTNKAGTSLMSDLTQATAGKKPVKAAASYNSSAPGVTFDGVDDGLLATVTGVPAGSPIQVIAAIQPGTNASGSPRVITVNRATGNDTDSGGYIPLYYQTSNSKYAAWAGIGLSQAAASPGSPHVLESTLQRSGNPGLVVHKFTVDGVDAPQFVQNWDATLTVGKLGLCMNTGGTENYAGTVAAFIVAYGEYLSPAKRTMIRAYFQGLDGTVSNVNTIGASVSLGALSLTSAVAVTTSTGAIINATPSLGALTLSAGVTVADPASVATIAYIAGANAQYITASSGATSSGIDTTGADFLLASISFYGGGDAPTLTDSKGNTWTALTRYDAASANPCVRNYYCVAPVVGASHTFTVAGNNDYASLTVAAFSGVDQTSPIDVVNSGTSSSTAGGPGSVSSGNVTPTQNGSLLIAAYAGSGQPAAFNGTPAFTVVHSHSGQSSANYSGALAYYVQATAAAIGSGWNWTTATFADHVASLTAIKAAATAGAPTAVNVSAAPSLGGLTVSSALAVTGTGTGGGTSYAFYDNANRADAAPASGALGVSSGDGSGNGAGIAWISNNGGIDGNRIYFDGTVAYANAIFNIGSPYVKFGAKITVSGSTHGPVIAVGCNSSVGKLFQFSPSDNGGMGLFQWGDGGFANLDTTSPATGLSVGTYQVEIRLTRANRFEAYVDGVLKMAGNAVWAPNTTTDTYCMIGHAFNNTGTRFYFDDVWVELL